MKEIAERIKLLVQKFLRTTQIFKTVAKTYLKKVSEMVCQKFAQVMHAVQIFSSHAITTHTH